jgi:hypothetical protein
MTFFGYDIDNMLIGVGVAWICVVILLVILFHHLRSN